MKKFWSIGRWVLLAFFVYAVFKSPDNVADIVRTTFTVLRDAGQGIIAVFDSLLGD